MRLLNPNCQAASLQDIGPWKGASRWAFSSWQPAFTTPAVAWKRSYVNGENKAAIYIAYYRHQDSQRKLGQLREHASPQPVMTSGLWLSAAARTSTA